MESTVEIVVEAAVLAYLDGLFPEVPQRRLQTATRQQAVLKTLQEVEEGRLVGEHNTWVGYPVIANQNQFCRLAWGGCECVGGGG